MSRYRNIRLLSSTAQYLIIVILLVAVLFPIAWMVSTSFKNHHDLFETPPRWIPRNPTAAAYQRIFISRAGAGGVNFLTYFKNSLIVCGATVIFCILLAIFSGYALSRFHRRGRKSIFTSILITQMFPLPMFLITFYIMFMRLKLLNSYTGLIIAYTSFSLPFCIWMIKGFFDKIPLELEEAALIDGCSRMSALWRVVIPLVSPGVVAIGIFAFLSAWDEFMFSLTLMSQDAMRTLPPGIVLSFVGEFDVRWEDMMAASVVATLPVLIVFLILQKYLVEGLTAGDVKG